MNSNPTGGAIKKRASQARIDDVSKRAVFCISGRHDLEDAEDIDLIPVKNANDALGKLEIEEEIELQTLEGGNVLEKLEIRKTGDLLAKGLAKKLPTLGKQKRQSDLLHKMHNGLMSSYRLQKTVENLLDPKNAQDKKSVITFLKLAAADLLPE